MILQNFDCKDFNWTEKKSNLKFHRRTFNCESKWSSFQEECSYLLNSNFILSVSCNSSIFNHYIKAMRIGFSQEGTKLLMQNTTWILTIKTKQNKNKKTLVPIVVIITLRGEQG